MGKLAGHPGRKFHSLWGANCRTALRHGVGFGGSDLFRHIKWGPAATFDPVIALCDLNCFFRLM